MKLNKNTASYIITIKTYEKVLNGEIKSFSPYFFDLRYRKKRIITLIQYLIEDKLNMKPEEATKILNLKLLKQYKLDCLLKYVKKPIELDKQDVSHLIWYAYNNEVKRPTDEELTIMMYKKVLSGELKNFPKNYFLDGLRGEKKVGYCLKYLCFEILKLKKDEIPKTITVDILKKYKLKIVLNNLYLSVFDLIISVFPNEFSAKDF
ncbi:MAG: DUF4046 domain-containing protein [Candidatus Woesearchaeota archaeon]